MRAVTRIANSFGLIEEEDSSAQLERQESICTLSFRLMVSDWQWSFGIVRQRV